MVLVDDDSCYGVKHVEEQANVVHSVSEWLSIWKNTEVHKRKTIISTSDSILPMPNLLSQTMLSAMYVQRMRLSS